MLYLLAVLCVHSVVGNDELPSCYALCNPGDGDGGGEGLGPCLDGASQGCCGDDDRSFVSPQGRACECNITSCEQPEASAAMVGTDARPGITGHISFAKDEFDEYVRIFGSLAGLPEGSHAIHVHQFGDVSDPNGLFAGGHYNPSSAPHGCYPDLNRHRGDIGNITVGPDGLFTFPSGFHRDLLELTGENSIVGRSVIIHQLHDDCQQPDGNAGARIAQGVVGVRNTLLGPRFYGTGVRNPSEGRTSGGGERAVAVLRSTDGNNVEGVVYFEETEGISVKVTARVRKFIPGALHGLHIHEYGDLSAGDGTSSGGHFNAANTSHDLPPTLPRHTGDMGNVRAWWDGEVYHDNEYDLMTLNESLTSIIGRAVALHENEDLGYSEQPTGGAGARIAVGVIGLTDQPMLVPGVPQVPVWQSNVSLDNFAPESWNRVDPHLDAFAAGAPVPVCSDGSSYNFWYYRGAAEGARKVVVDFQGGGACWDYATCTEPSLYTANLDAVRQRFEEGNLLGGVFLKTAANPVGGWDHLFIPYCTGDIFSGNATRIHVSPDGLSNITIEHRGLVAARFALGWLAAQFVSEAPAEVLSTGCSAGGYGSIFHAPDLIREYSPRGTRVVQFSDAAVGAGSELTSYNMTVLWNAFEILPQYIPRIADVINRGENLSFLELYSAVSEHFSENLFAQFNTLLDGVQIAFFRILMIPFPPDPTDEQWSANMTHVINTLINGHENFEAMIAPGANHCEIPFDRMYTTEGTRVRDGENVTFVAWLRELVDGHYDPPAIPDDDDDVSGMGGWQIALIIVGAVLLAVLLVGGIFVVKNRNSTRRYETLAGGKESTKLSATTTSKYGA